MNRLMLLLLTIFTFNIITNQLVSAVEIFGISSKKNQPKSQTEVYESKRINNTTCNCQDSYAELVETLSPAVVSISVTSVQEIQSPNIGKLIEFIFPFGISEDSNQIIKREAISAGSGFIIKPNGIVVTNHHVVENAKTITITTQDNKEYKAKIIGSDPKTDIAVLQIDSHNSFPFVTFGNSDNVRTGDKVVVISNAAGLSGTVTAGVVSGKSRNLSTSKYEMFIQTDAAINQGSSGAALFSVSKGEVIGMATMLLSGASYGGFNIGLNFAVESNLCANIVNKIMKKEKIVRGWLGITYSKVDKKLVDALALKSDNGVFIRDIAAMSPASKAGLRVGDIITKFGNIDITKNVHIHMLVLDTKIGAKVDLTVIRDKKTITVPVVIEEFLEQKQENKKQSISNQLLSVIEMNNNNRDARIPQEVKGVIVLDITSQTMKRNREIMRGDILIKIDGMRVVDLKSFDSAIQSISSSSKKYVVIEFYRDGKHMVEAVQIKAND